MKRLVNGIFAVLTCVFLFGCAHPITMSPDFAAVAAPATTQVIDKKVAYFMSDALRTVEVTTPGGGGDKVRYFPYRDIEPGLYKALTAIFTNVTRVQSLTDTAALQASGISMLITPEITTNSSSDGAFTWPPTQFSVNLVCTITDVNRKPLETIRVSGEGAATFSEFTSNHSLAAVRASNDALAKLIKALGESPELRR